MKIRYKYACLNAFMHMRSCIGIVSRKKESMCVVCLTRKRVCSMSHKKATRKRVCAYHKKESMCVRTYSLSYCEPYSHDFQQKYTQLIQNSLHTNVRTCMHPHTCVRTFMHLYIHQMHVQILSCKHTNFILRSRGILI
jgi:hypothetical protein